MCKLSDDDLEIVVGGSQIPVEIKSGDTLGKLAEKFHCTVEDICRWNNILATDTIYAGQILKFKF